MPFNIVRNDITKMETDAIVNAANSRLLMGGGVCGAIFNAAGAEKMQAACDKIGFCGLGEAVITKGFNLKAKYVIHTVGPIYKAGNTVQEQQLYSAYASSLKLAKSKRIKSIAFPLISSGIFGYPKSEAITIARQAIKDFLQDNDMDIYLVVYDRDAFEISKGLFDRIKSYIAETLVLPQSYDRRIDSRSIPIERSVYESEMMFPQMAKNSSSRSLDDLLKNLDETFSQMLLRLIDERNLKDSEVYKKANIDRKLFSKIRKDKNYRPKKSTVLSFAIALGLSLDETKDILGKAGFAFSPSSRADVIVEYFIENENYDIFEINEALFAFDEPLLGGKYD